MEPDPDGIEDCEGSRLRSMSQLSLRDLGIAGSDGVIGLTAARAGEAAREGPLLVLSKKSRSHGSAERSDCWSG